MPTRILGRFCLEALIKKNDIVKNYELSMFEMYQAYKKVSDGGTNPTGGSPD